MATSKAQTDENLPQKQRQHVRDEAARQRLAEGKESFTDLDDVPTVAQEAAESEIPSVQEWVTAEHSRPDFADENADGLDRTTVETLRKAGDVSARPRRPE